MLVVTACDYSEGASFLFDDLLYSGIYRLEIAVMLIALYRGYM
jgi:hypothetical protein